MIFQFVFVVAAVTADDCTYTPKCDYGKGSRDKGVATTQESCCIMCAERPGCASGVFDGQNCWYKTEAQVKAGCATSSRVIAACNPKSVKPNPLPILPPLSPPKCPSGVKPVQVFIMMGQSNMLGEGQKFGPKRGTLEFAVKTEGKYPYLYDKTSHTWTTSKTVRNVFTQGNGGIPSLNPIQLFHNEFMTALNSTPAPFPGMVSAMKTSIGPELGIGFALGAYTTEPVMTLKTCTGGRSLGWDLLPPGSKGFEYENYTYAGYHQSPEKWKTGTTPVPIGWSAGIQYDGDTQRAYDVLGNISAFYPGQQCYEVAGFFWWQGDKDSRDMGLSLRYETNLVALIKQLRVQYGSPHAKFVTASLGQTVKGSTRADGLILDAMLNVANATKYPDFAGNVAAVYSHPLSMGSDSGNHYGHNAETYMNVGEAMGAKMVAMLKASEKAGEQ